MAVNMDPQQALFSGVMAALMTNLTGIKVFDGILPPSGTAYPFVYVGELSMIDIPNKSCLCGEISLTIHVWHDDPHERGMVSDLIGKIKAACRGMKYFDRFSFYVTGMQTQILPDASTGVPLMHGMVDAEFRFT